MNQKNDQLDQQPSQVPKVKSKVGGTKGKGDIVVKTTVVPIEEAIEKGLGEEEVTPSEFKELPDEATLEVNKALVETVCLVVGKTAVLMTKIPEMAFDEDETNQLVSLWSPLVPKLSPLVTALLGIAIIVVGKVGVYVSLRKGRVEEKATEAAKEEGKLEEPTE